MSSTIEQLEFRTDAGPARFDFRAGTNDRHVILASCVEDEYRLAGVDMGYVAIDIGAHIGAVTVRLAMQGARVYAFEPVKENYDLLCHNVRQNGLDDMVTCCREAVLNADGTTTVYLGGEADPWHQWMGGIYSPSTNRGQVVDAVSLDTIFTREWIYVCDVIKLDAEGAEYDILRGASEATLDRIGRIVGEYHGIPGGPVEDQRGTLLGYTRGGFVDVTPEGDPAGFDFVRRGMA